MYTLTHNGNALFDPRIDGYPLQSPIMTLEANKFGTLSFTIFPGHPQYGQIEKLTSLISVYKDDALYMQFRPTYKKQCFNAGFTYKCQDITSRLNDFRYRPLTYTGTVSGFISAVIASYNARVNSSEQFTVGNITGGTDSFTFKVDNPLGHWDALQKVVSDKGGYILSRYSGGAVYIDYLQDSDFSVSSQAIRYGENMTDMFIETDSDNTFSVLYPLGRNGSTTIDIKSVNSGVDYLESSAGIAIYGRRETCIIWENVTSASQLKTLAQAELDKIAVKFAETVQVSAVDLHNADVSISSFNFMDLVDCVSTVHGLSHRYVLGSIMIPLGSPDSSLIQLGEKRQSLNDRIILEKKETAAAVEAVNNRVNEVDGRVDDANDRIDDVEDSIKETWVEYALGASALNHPTSGWDKAIPQPTTSTPYVWARDVVSLNGGTTTYSNYRREFGIENIYGTASNALVTAGNIANGTTAVPRVTSTGVDINGNTLEISSTGEIKMLGNSEIYFGTASSNSALVMNKDGVAIGSGGSIAIAANGTFEVASRKFSIDASGNVEMEGKVTATSGKIGGFKIDPGFLGSDTSGVYMAQNLVENNVLVHAGGLRVMDYYNPGSYVFRAETTGNVTITGNVNATTGKIGGFEIYSGSLYSTNQQVVVTDSSILVGPVIQRAFTADQDGIKAKTIQLYDSTNRAWVDVTSKILAL